MARFRILATVALCLAAWQTTWSVASALSVTTTLPSTEWVLESEVPTEEVTDTTAVWRIQNDPSECLNFNPRPNCGFAPTDAGERGGALQVSLFFIMMGAIAVIGTVITRNVVRRDRAIAADLARREPPSGL